MLLTIGVLILCSCGTLASDLDNSASQTACSLFDTERINIPGGIELVTFLARSAQPSQGSTHDHSIPLLTILRDTLGDSDPTNDRLRYAWMLTFTDPTLTQKVAAAVPFF